MSSQTNRAPGDEEPEQGRTCRTSYSELCVADGEEITPLIEIEIHLWSSHDQADKRSAARTNQSAALEMSEGSVKYVCNNLPDV